MSFQLRVFWVMAMVVVGMVLLAAWGGQVQADGPSSPATDPVESVDKAGLACLVLVGGTALLTVGVFAHRVKQLLS